MVDRSKKDEMKRKEESRYDENGQGDEEAPLFLEREEAGIVEEKKKAEIDKDKLIEDLSREKELYFERLLRLQAEFENFRKRIERERNEFYLMALSELVGKLLPIIDDFERALSVHHTSDVVKYHEGMELIYKGLRSILECFGLKEVPSIGERFDPRVHQAMVREESDEVEEETVVEEFRKGYFFKDRLLRPAMVKVAVKREKPVEATAEDSPDKDKGA
jgi:molecular chaperone GrpE